MDVLVKAGDPLPNDDSIARYCGGSHCDDDHIDGAAFELRVESGEKELSVNWIEYFGLDDTPSAIQEIREIFERKRTVGSTAKFAVLNVQKVKTHVREKMKDNRVLRINYDPIEEPPELADCSHSSIYGMEPDQKLIADLIAQVINEVHPAKIRRQTG